MRALALQPPKRTEQALLHACVADPSPVTRRRLAEALRRLGVNVVECATPQALRHALQDRPDLIVVDSDWLDRELERMAQGGALTVVVTPAAQPKRTETVLAEVRAALRRR